MMVLQKHFFTPVMEQQEVVNGEAGIKNQELVSGSVNLPGSDLTIKFPLSVAISDLKSMDKSTTTTSTIWCQMSGNMSPTLDQLQMVMVDTSSSSSTQWVVKTVKRLTSHNQVLKSLTRSQNL